jgi:hypothetical protein
MIRSAPISLAAITPHSPTAPSPTTTAVEPGLLDLGGLGGPPAGAQHVGRGEQAGPELLAGYVVGGDQASTASPSTRT